MVEAAQARRGAGDAAEVRGESEGTGWALLQTGVLASGRRGVDVDIVATAAGIDATGILSVEAAHEALPAGCLGALNAQRVANCHHQYDFQESYFYSVVSAKG